MKAPKKPFKSWTKQEATSVAKDIVRNSGSEAEIRRRLSEAGFDEKGAAICCMSSGSMFDAMVMVWGPNGEIINA